jgi:dihydrofolate reductase
MSRVIVVAFTSLDGVTQDPSGNEGTTRGGWLFTFGPELIAGDKFGVGEVLETGTLLLGRRTWEQFAKLWPNRDDPFSRRMNAAAKLVASRSLHDVAEWQNSARLRGDLVAEVRERRQAGDIVVMGSASVARTLMDNDLVDEYRLLVFPLVLGEGARLFPEGSAPASLVLAAAEPAGPLARLTYTRQS